MSAKLPTPVRLDCYPEHDAAVAMAVEPNDVTQTSGNTHTIFHRPPEQASNVLVAMKPGTGRNKALALASLDSLGSA